MLLFCDIISNFVMHPTQVRVLMWVNWCTMGWLLVSLPEALSLYVHMLVNLMCG